MPRNGTNCYRRKDGRWVAVLPASETPEKVRQAFYGETQSEALRKRREARDRIQDGLPTKARKTTLGVYLDDWLETCVKPLRAQNTITGRENAIKLHLKPALGQVALEALTPGQVRKLYQQMTKEGYQPNTIRGVHAALSVALTQAVKDRILRENVAKLVTPPSPPKKEVKHFTPDEAKRFIEVARDEPLGVFLITLLLTGLRKAELIDMTWEDVSLDRLQLQVRGTKSRKSLRTVPILPQLADLLRKHKPAQQREFLVKGWEWKPSAYLFPAEKTYGRMYDAKPNDALRSILEKRPDLPTLTVHQLRHSAASLLFALGADPKEVQEILGHATLAITMDLYTHLLPERKREAVDRLSVLFG